MLNPSCSKSELIVHPRQPFNAEPPLDRLRRDLVTSQKDFYARSHGSIPRLDEASHRFRVEGLVRTPLDVWVPDLRARFPACSVPAMMQCAGNRRADLQQVRPTSEIRGRPAPSAMRFGQASRWPMS